jgi:spermidine/putrescine-binding protein
MRLRGILLLSLAAGLALLAAAGCRKVENPMPPDVNTGSGFLANYKIEGPAERTRSVVETYRKRKQPEVLRVLTRQDLLSPALIRRYQEATRVLVEVDFYKTTEELTQRLQAGEKTDLIFLPGYGAQRLVRLNLLAPLNTKRIPNLANIDRDFRGLIYDPDTRFTAPLVWSTYGIAYNRRLLPTPPSRWSALFEPGRLFEASSREERRTTRSGALERVQASVRQLRELALAEGPPTVHAPVDLKGREAPELRFGRHRPLTDHRLVDTVSANAGGNATFFTRAGDTYVRLSTSVRTGDGARAIGTELDPVGPAIAALRRGEAYYGIADILGRTHLTAYEPLRDEGGNIIGVAYYGYPIESAAEANRLQEEAAGMESRPADRAEPALAVAYPDSIHRVFGAALVSLGYGLNEADPVAIRAAAGYLEKVAENLHPQILLNEELVDAMVRERISLAMMPSNQAIAAIQRNPSIGFVSPEETTWIRVESAGLPAAASRERRELAEDFINYVLHPNIAAAVANHALAGSTVPAGRGYLLPIIRFGPLAARLPDYWVVQTEDQENRFDSQVFAKLKATPTR